MPDLIGRLVTTCEIEPPEITRQEIELSGDQTTFEGLIEIGALAHVGNADVAMCTVCANPIRWPLNTPDKADTGITARFQDTKMWKQSYCTGLR